MQKIKIKKIRLIIIEDNRLLRDGICALLKKENDINVVSAFDDYNFNFKKITDLKPDVLLVDLGLANCDSLELVRKIAKKYPGLKIIVMDLIPIHEDIIKYIEAGVSGFLVKDATGDEFTDTIRLVTKGEKVLPTKLTDSLFSQIMNIAEVKLSSKKIAESIKMTKRESEIVTLISNGFTNKEISNKLNISIYTVKSHVHNILEKMALNTRLKIAINAKNITE